MSKIEKFAQELAHFICYPTDGIEVGGVEIAPPPLIHFCVSGLRCVVMNIIHNFLLLNFLNK